MITGYVGRDDFVLRQARDKRVLHLGCVGGTDQPTQQRTNSYPSTLHARLSAIAKTTLGVDRSAEVVCEWRDRHRVSNILIGNVEELDLLDLRPEFDLIVAGDIIEHLSCPGRMLDGIRRICTSETRVIITTPNAFGLPNYLRFVSGRFQDGEQHVLTFNPVNLVQILERHDLRVVELKTCWQSRSKDAGGVGFKIGRRLFERLPRLGGTLLAVARSPR